MDERKIVVPEGMLKAAWHAQLPADNPTYEWDEGDELSKKSYRRVFEAALRWLLENPIVPSETDVIILADVSLRAGDDRNKQVQDVAVEWQRRMFLAPEPEVPEEIKDLLATPIPTANNPCAVMEIKNVNEKIIEVYRRGKKAAK